jgi:metallo-beta-lactamase family protein
MRIQFCGADRTVTGSSHLIEINGLRILLDCGMYQGSRDEANRLNHWLPENATKVDAVILSHGHLDHCGKIPVLTRAGYSGPIYCTAATTAVARIVLEDSAAIQEEDSNYLNRRSVAPGAPTIQPLYVRSDVPRVIKQMKRAPYGQKMDLGKGVWFTLYDAGHILGSAYVILEWQQGSATRKLLFTADVGRYNTPILRDPQQVPGPVDYVITESTYGGKTHAPMSEVGPQLLDAVKAAIANRSRLLVPAFAVGRTQTILWYIQRFIQEGQIPPIAIHVDSPMGVAVSEAHSEFRENYDQETLDAIGQKDLFGLSHVDFAISTDDSKRINGDRGPCVIIASSPTCEFGRILHHLAHSVERPNDIVVFTGWIPFNTLGRRLQAGDKRVRIYDRWYDVKCQVRTIHGLSAHADGDELLRFLKPTIRPETHFYVVHGEAEQAEVFAGRLVEAGAGRATAPAMETTVISEKAEARGAVGEARSDE